MQCVHSFELNNQKMKIKRESNKLKNSVHFLQFLGQIQRFFFLIMIEEGQEEFEKVSVQSEH